MRRLAALILLVPVALAAPATTGANTYTVVYNSSADYATAQTLAAGMGGYLATITSAAEQAAVQAAITASSPAQSGAFWIGLRETATECCYIWEGGESTCYSNFYDGEPNNGTGGTETRGHMMWNLSDASRRGTWNDAPPAGFGGTFDISRLGFVVEIGAPSNQGPCTPCIRVSASALCNQSPPGQLTTKRVTGVSSGSGIIQRTISDVTEPPLGPDQSQEVQATYIVQVPVTGSGVQPTTVTAAFIDSINRKAAPGGFVANLVYPGSDPTLFWMSRVAPYTSNDVSSVPGMGVDNPTGHGGGVNGPIAGWPVQIALVLLLAGAGSRWIRSRRRQQD